ncbi:MAG TPA: sigma-70 family RNA polymerase sigma factor [Candidatus Dormibacteraeota bacterium]
MGTNLEAASDRATRALSSEQESFEALFKAEYNRVAGIANRVLGDAQEAEDVAQEVFLDFHRLHSAKAQYAAPWLYRASAHTALNRVRGRRRREKRELATAHDEAGHSLDPQLVAETNEQRERLRRALAKLPAKPAAVLVLRSSGLSYAEVAEAVGVSTGQIGTLLRRAETALRKEVNRESPE